MKQKLSKQGDIAEEMRKGLTPGYLDLWNYKTTGSKTWCSSQIQMHFSSNPNAFLCVAQLKTILEIRITEIVSFSDLLPLSSIDFAEMLVG